MVRLPDDQHLDISAFALVLHDRYIQNSYKFYWLSAIVEEISHNKTSMSFQRLVYRMVAKSWYSLVQYRLSLGHQDKLFQLVMLIKEKFQPRTDVSEEELISLLEAQRDGEVAKGAAHFFKYVPYRLLSPFFPQLVGSERHNKNGQIVELSVSPSCLYTILDRTKEIVIHERWFDYIQRNYPIVSGWIQLKLIQYLQRRNPNVPGIPFKLMAPQQRDLTLATRYWKAVIPLAQISDVYTDLAFSKENTRQYGSISIDHFLPWTFVLHDQMWNLVPTFHTINSAKSDALPSMDDHLERFCRVQSVAVETALRHNLPRRLLEDYYSLGANAFTPTSFEPSCFAAKLKETIRPLHAIASNQGFVPWRTYPAYTLKDLGYPLVGEDRPRYGED